MPRGAHDGSLAEAYRRLLSDPDPAVRERAARDWCTWEDAHVAWRLSRAWPGSRLVVIDDSGHGASPSTNRALTAETDRFRVS